METRLPRALALSLVVLAISLPFTARAASGWADLQDAAGKKVGRASFTSTRGGVRVRVDVNGLAAGMHGIHLHGVGKCEGPDFKSAGAHLNPTGKQHGLKNPAGAHAGDLPNLTVGGNGRGKADFTARGARLGAGEGSLFGPDGTALVVHADPDDEKTDPSGNSGARIACGVVRRR